MRIRRSPMVFVLALIVLLAVFVAGCGGGESNSGGGEGKSEQQGDADKGASKKQEGKDKPKTKTALGKIGSVKPDDKRIVLRPSSEDKDAKPMKFKLRPKGRIIAEGKEVKLDEVESGQQAKIEYVSGKKINGALSVEIVGGGGTGGGGTTDSGGETTD